MKRLTVFFTTLIVLTGLTASAQAVIKFDKTAHNFGTFLESKPVSCVFSFTNNGNQPLVIQQAFSSCGCTVANYTKTPIAPGKKGQINVTYNGKGKFPGYFKKPITIRSNASNSMTRIYIEGTMQKDEK